MSRIPRGRSHYLRAEWLDGHLPGVEPLIRIELGEHIGRDWPHAFWPDRELRCRQEAEEPQQEYEEEQQQVTPFSAPITVVLRTPHSHVAFLYRNGSDLATIALVALQHRENHTERAAR
jgi:hypothetical protein